MKPDHDNNRLPLHSDECPEFDGKRCRAIGFRPARFCESALIEERAAREKAEAVLAAASNAVPEQFCKYHDLAEAVTRMGRSVCDTDSCRDHALAEAAREFVKAAQVDGQHAYEVAWKRLLAAIEANR